MALNPMPGVVDKKRGDTWRHPQAGEGHVTTEQRLEGCVYKPRTPRAAGPPRGWKRQEGFSLRTSRETLALPTPSCGVLASGSERDAAYVVSSLRLWSFIAAARRHAPSARLSRAHVPSALALKPPWISEERVCPPPRVSVWPWL